MASEPATLRFIGSSKAALAAWLRTYAQIYFSQSLVAGLLFAAATFVVPRHGLLGLLGLAFADLFARLLGRPKEHIADGYYGFNGLLIGLALGWRLSLTWQAALFLAAIVFFGVLAAALLRHLFQRYLGLPVLSLPFLLAAWAAWLAAPGFAGVEKTLEPVLQADLGGGALPGLVELYLRSLGAAFYQLSVASGILVFLGLLWFSRWATLLSIIGFAGGYGMYAALGGNALDLRAQFVGLNFILTAIAVGGVWIALRPASLLFALCGGALAAVLSAAFSGLLRPYELPVLAAPFIVATYLMLFAVMIRAGRGRLQLIYGEIDSPEKNLSRLLHRERRYPDPAVPVVYLPVSGRWRIAQGPGGDQTHRGPWAQAWDFDIGDDEGRAHRGDGAALTDYYAFQAPVFAPGDAKVVRVVNHFEDNPLGEVNIANNWGNLVVLWHAGAIYSALCHLQKGSIVVKEGDAVVAGQLLGRVGNSGRSPTPHLHFQLQASPEIGAPTIYGEFLHYVAGEAAGRRYVTHGAPAQGAIVARLEVDEEVRRALTLAPGREWRWSGTRDGQRLQEAWTSEIDPLGGRRLVADDGGAAVPFFADGSYVTLLDYQGPAKRLLGLFYLGLPRAPFVAEPQIRWNDGPAANAFLPLVTRFVHELCLPFGEIVKIETASAIVPWSGGIRVATQVRSRSRAALRIDLPDRIEIDLAPGRGPTAMRAWRGEREILTAEAAS